MARDPLDRYYTPKAAAVELLRELEPHLRETTYGIVVDPSCGRGALLDAVAAELPNYAPRERVGYEIDPDAAAYTRRYPHSVIEGDFLTLASGPIIDLFLANPPYSLAQEFVTKMLDERSPYTITAALLRLGFLASQKRSSWWKENPPSAIRVLSARPSFTNDGRTDNSEYAWYVWSPPILDLEWAPFGWYNKEQ